MGENRNYFKPYDVSYGTAILQEKDVVPINPDMGGLSITYDFYNNLEFPVTVGFRDGVRISVKPKNDSSKPQRFYINRHIKMNKYLTTLYLPDTSTHREHLVLANNYANGLLNHHDNFISGPVDHVVEQYCVDSSELLTQGSYYLGNLDLVVTTRPIDQWRHPSSPEGIFRRQIMETNNVNTENAFGLGIELVCRHSSGEGYRYINLSNNVFRVPVTHSYIKKPGLYITYNGLITNNSPASAPEVKYFEWDEEDKFPVKLFDSWYDALNYGDVEAERKREIATLKHEIERLMMENKRMQAETEKEDRYRKEIINELEHERNKNKHEMEMRSMERKDSSEFMKWLPAIISSVVALITVTVKLSSNNK